MHEAFKGLYHCLHLCHNPHHVFGSDFFPLLLISMGSLHMAAKMAMGISGASGAMPAHLLEGEIPSLLKYLHQSLSNKIILDSSAEGWYILIHQPGSYILTWVRKLG